MAVDRALDFGLVGVGGRLSSPPSDADDALARVSDEHDERVARRPQLPKDPGVVT